MRNFKFSGKTAVIIPFVSKAPAFVMLPGIPKYKR